LRTLLAECLGPVRIVPDVRFLELALNFRQAFRLSFIVKDTPLTQWRVRGVNLSVA
jgi:hypothetical protein